MGSQGSGHTREERTGDKSGLFIHFFQQSQAKLAAVSLLAAAWAG